MANIPRLQLHGPQIVKKFIKIFFKMFVAPKYIEDMHCIYTVFAFAHYIKRFAEFLI